MAALGLLVIVLARGGGEPSAQRQALEHDPMASYVAPGDARRHRLPERGHVLGKQVEASYTRLQLRESAQALDLARAAATEAG